jgi:predicted esterase
VADPIRAVKRIAGRPLFMVNGRHDSRVRSDQAEALFAAAGEPKTLTWYNGGHWPPDRVIEEAADWLARTLSDE